MANKLRDKFNQAILYFRSTEAVSKPIAYLMLFFGLAFITSVLIGLFLAGQWGYRKVIPLDEPVAVTSPVDTGEGDNKATQTTEVNSSSGQKNITVASPDSTAGFTQNTSKVLPDTGSNFIVEFISVFLAGYILSRLYYKITG